MCTCVCVCVCELVGALGLVVQLVESWVYDPEDTGGHWFESQGRRKNKNKKHRKYSSPPAHPSVKRVPGLVLGEQSTPTVSHCTTNGSGGTTGCPHRQWEAWLVPPASPLPGLQASAHSTGTSYLYLVHRCPGLSRNT